PARLRLRWSSTTSTWNWPCVPCIRPSAWTRNRPQTSAKIEVCRRARNIVLELRSSRRRGREVEGTPLLREHTTYTRIEGSNPSVAAKFKSPAIAKLQGFFLFGL